MRMLVTGGAGFIGSHLVDALINMGNDVVCIDNESAESNEKFYWNEKAHNFKIDICDYQLIYPLFENIDCVFHLASDARIQPAILNPRKSVETNAIGTFNILEASRQNNVERVVLSSTSSTYGKKNPIPNIETQKEDCLTPYSTAKIFGENLAKVYYNLYGLKTISLRYFNVYGERQPLKGQYAPVIGLFLKQKQENKSLTIVGDGTQKRDFTHVQDVVQANLAAGISFLYDELGFKDEDVFGQVYNIGCSKNYSILEIASMISEDISFIPARPGEAQETLSDTNKFRNIFKWSPNIQLNKWIGDFKNENNL